jgi:hypothetical protein
MPREAPSAPPPHPPSSSYTRQRRQSRQASNRSTGNNNASSRLSNTSRPRYTDRAANVFSILEEVRHCPIEQRAERFKRLTGESLSSFVRLEKEWNEIPEVLQKDGLHFSWRLLKEYGKQMKENGKNRGARKSAIGLLLTS